MKNELQIFINDEFSIEAIERDGEPWFIAKPLCEQIDVSNVSDAVSRLDDDEKAAVAITDSRSVNGVEQSRTRC